MTPRSLKARVDTALKERLGFLGFATIQAGIFTRTLTRDVSGWIGIPLASRKRGGEVDADPMVGVRCEPVEQRMPQSQLHEATVFRPLYELLDDGYRTWSFSAETVDEDADELVNAVTEVAVPFMESLTTLTAIEEALSSWAFADVRRRRLPAALLLRGDEDAVRTELDREKAELAEEGYSAAAIKEYEAFGQELLHTVRD